MGARRQAEGTFVACMPCGSSQGMAVSCCALSNLNYHRCLAITKTLQTACSLAFSTRWPLSISYQLQQHNSLLAGEVKDTYTPAANLHNKQSPHLHTLVLLAAAWYSHRWAAMAFRTPIICLVTWCEPSQLGVFIYHNHHHNHRHLCRCAIKHSKAAW